MPDPVFAHVELRIVPGEMTNFLATMQVLAPLMQQSGWGFIGAWQVKVGRAHTLRVIWRLPSADAFFAERPFMRSHPQMAQFKSVLEAAIAEETVTLMVSVPYGIN